VESREIHSKALEELTGARTAAERDLLGVIPTTSPRIIDSTTETQTKPAITGKLL